MLQQVSPISKIVRRLVVVSAGYNTEQTFGELFDRVQVIGHNEATSEDLNFNEDTTLLLEGGTDVGTHYYGEEPGAYTDNPDTMRDLHESFLFFDCIKKGGTAIGVCRGAQFLCALSGGRLVQHVNKHNNNGHLIKTSTGEIFPAAADHHQMMFPWHGTTKREKHGALIHFNPPKFDLLAWAASPQSSVFLNGSGNAIPLPKGFLEPEVVWFPTFRSLAIQPHPEWMDQDDPFPKYCRELVKQYVFGTVVPA